MLVNRSTRSVSLTEAGRTFHEHTSEVDTRIKRAADVVRRGDLHPTGTVAFAIPSSLGAALLPALTSQFQSTWPDLRFNIHFDDRPVDLIAGSFDLPIQISQKLDGSSLISRRLATTRKVLAASGGYLDKYCIRIAMRRQKSEYWLTSLKKNCSRCNQVNSRPQLATRSCIIPIARLANVAGVSAPN